MSPSSDLVFVMVRAFILTLFPAVEVIRGLQNNTPMPTGGFIALTPIGQARLGTNESRYNGVGSKFLTRHTQYDVQFDFYGPDSSDWATTVETAFRDQYGCDTLGPVIAPLYCGNAQQAPLIDGEENYEERWIISASVQFNPEVELPQQYADILNINLFKVD